MLPALGLVDHGLLSPDTSGGMMRQPPVVLSSYLCLGWHAVDPKVVLWGPGSHH